jgi:hypothetical protein
MKNLLILVCILLISSCGKKGDASHGVTPLLPASEALTASLNSYGLEFLNPSKLPNNEPAIICFNSQTLNHKKISILKEMLPTEDRILGQLIPAAINSLEEADPNSRLCPKIFLSIAL